MTPRASATPNAAPPIRVMVVDDSAVIRGLLSRALEADSAIEVVSSVGNGQLAVNAISRQPIDVVVLDIEMPVMDGLTALPKLIEASPATKVVMASTLTKRNADISIRAMAAGAADYVTKPTSTRDINAADSFKDELLRKVRALGRAARQGSGLAVGRSQRPFSADRGRAVVAAGRSSVTLRSMPANFGPKVIAIGSSTGGPQALFKVLGYLSSGIKQPILITQHMPATFTAILAEHITRQCGLTATEGRDGEPLVGGHCYVAPGDYHMVVEPRNGEPVIRLNQKPPENFCRPAVDVMLRSIVQTYGRNVLSVILTGMGQDGMKGCQAAAAAGGVIVAQDEATSVVWGMPGAAAQAGVCNSVLPLAEIGPHLRKIASRTA